jgi:hypothetical protein
VPSAVEQHQRILLSGFLPVHEYLQLLAHAAVVVVLTCDTDCLVCGGYEALGAQRPLVLSDTPLLRSCFSTCAEYAHHDRLAICRAVSRALTMDLRGQAYEEGQRRFRRGFEQEWQLLQDAMGGLGVAVPAAAPGNPIARGTRS